MLYRRYEYKPGKVVKFFLERNDDRADDERLRNIDGYQSHTVF